MSGDLLRRHAQFGDGDALLELLSYGANPCSTDNYGLTALHLAVWNGHLRCVQILCANEVGRGPQGNRMRCVDMATATGATPLHLAAIDGCDAPNVIKMLIECGARVDLKDNHGDTPLDVAIASGRQEVIDALSLIPTAEDMLNYKKQLIRLFKVQRVAAELDGLRQAPIPRGMIMQEHDILPFARENYKGPHCRSTIQNLVIAKEQADANFIRRTRLMEARNRRITGDGSLPPPQLSPKLWTAGAVLKDDTPEPAAIEAPSST